MIGDFTDWARDQRDDLTGLMAEIELEQFGSDPIDGVYDRLEGIVKDAIQMVEDAILHDQTIEYELEDQGVGNTLVRRVERVVRDLEFDDPESHLLRDLTDAVVGYYDGDNLPDLIVMGRVS